MERYTLVQKYNQNAFDLEGSAVLGRCRSCCRGWTTRHCAFESVRYALPMLSGLLTFACSGGRQLDFARSGIEILVEVVDALKRRNLWGDHFEV